jgi:nitrate reductase NapA
MASAAFAFMRTFGMDEPMGCYDDLEAVEPLSYFGIPASEAGFFEN